MNENNPFLSNTLCFDNYAKGWKVTWASFGILLGISLLVALVRSPENIDEVYRVAEEPIPPLMIGLATLWGVFISIPVSAGSCWPFLKAARQQDVGVRDLFVAFGPKYWRVLGANLLVMLIVLAGLILLVIPGIYFGCRLAFVNYLILDRDISVKEAISTSWKMTEGRVLTLIGMGLLTIPIFAFGLLALIVGVFPACIWIGAAQAVLFNSVDSREQSQVFDSGEPVIEA